MKIRTLKLGIIAVNCYLIETDTAAIVIDPGFFSSEIVDFLKLNAHKERLILITHSHFDHISGLKQICEAVNVKFGIGIKDNKGLSDNSLNLSSRFRPPLSGMDADYKYNDDDSFAVGDLNVRVIETPGHTVGSVCYLINGVLFSGDTIFYESCGRTDFPGGNIDALKESFYKLINTLDGDTVVYPGHGESTTVKHETDNNPIGYLSAL